MTHNLPIRKYANKTENGITFRIKTGYYLRLLTPETVKLLRSTLRKITKDESCEHVLRSDTSEVVLVHCNIIKND